MTKHSDETLNVLGKTISREFFGFGENNDPNSNYCKSAWYNQMRIGNVDRILTLNSFFTVAWFKALFIEAFTLPAYWIMQCGIIFASYQFLHFAVTTIIHVINALQINKVFGKRIGFIAILLQKHFSSAR